MSLITEDGTGLTTAESYLSVADCATYFANRGITIWSTITTLQQEQALRRATDYMTQVYRGRWKGYRSNIYQALDWPRKAVVLQDTAINYMIPYNSIPKEISSACAEYAFRAAAGELAGDLSQGVISESVGSISTTYDTRSPQYTRYRAIDMMLSHLLMGSGASSQLVRV